MSARIVPAVWNDRAAGILAAAEQAASLADIRGQCESGAAQLFHVENDGGNVLGAYVLRVDPGASGDEGVIISAAGRADFDLVGAVLPMVETQFSGVVAVRFHTARPGLIRKAAMLGFRPAEFVLKKEVGAHGIKKQ